MTTYMFFSVRSVDNIENFSSQKYRTLLNALSNLSRYIVEQTKEKYFPSLYKYEPINLDGIKCIEIVGFSDMPYE